LTPLKPNKKWKKRIKNIPVHLTAHATIIPRQECILSDLKQSHNWKLKKINSVNQTQRNSCH